MWQIIAELRYLLIRIQGRIAKETSQQHADAFTIDESAQEENKDYQTVTCLCGELQSLVLEHRSLTLWSPRANRKMDLPTNAAIQAVSAILSPDKTLSKTIEILEDLWMKFQRDWQCRDALKGEEKDIFDSYSQAIAIEREARLDTSRRDAANGLYKVFVTQKFPRIRGPALPLTSRKSPGLFKV